MISCDDVKKEEDDTIFVVKIEVYDDEEKKPDSLKVENVRLSGSCLSDKLEDGMHQCVYCSVFRRGQEMRPLTKNSVALGLWCRKLGDCFRNRIETVISPLMCLAHFHDNGYDITEHVQDVAIPLSMGEKKQKTSTCCAYCYTVRPRNRMISVPFGEIREVWVEELGHRFQANLELMAFPSICMSHIRTSGQVVIPFPDEFIVQLEMETREKMTSAQNEYWFATCVCCSRSLRKSEMITVPLDEEILEKWSDLLGFRFDHNVLRKKKPRVCKSHFDKLDIDPNGELIAGALPMRYKSIACSSQTSPKSICTFCNKMNYWRNMRLVVKCPKRRDIWVRILGEDFRKNCSLDQLPTICRSHFYMFTLKNGKKYYGQIPNNLKVVENLGKTLDENAILEKENDMECSGPSQATSKENLKELYRFGWNTDGEMLRNNARLLLKNRDFNEDEVFKKRTATKCIFCYSFISQSFCSHKVFPGLYVFQKYAEVFGLQYKNRLKNVEMEKICKMKPCLRLCKSHLDQNMEAVPDKNRNYSVDELLDHNYADFNEPYAGIR